NSLAPATALPFASVTLPVTTSLSPAGGFGASLASGSEAASFLAGGAIGSVAVEAAMSPPTAISRPAARVDAHRRTVGNMGVTPLARAEMARGTRPGPANDAADSIHAGGTAGPAAASD